MAWSVLAKKGCTCLLGGAGGALYDSNGVLFATMRFHERAKILIIDEGETEPICPFPASVDPRMVRCEVFTVLSGSGISKEGTYSRTTRYRVAWGRLSLPLRALLRLHLRKERDAK